jgi:SAM-dependent methyltransferase
MHVPTLQLRSDDALPQTNDLELISEHLAPHGTELLELGCGAALTTRRLAERFTDCRIIACEVDRVQHAANLAIQDLPNVEFRLGGAEHITLPDASVDGVILLKSLHHVPEPEMDRAFEEIARVLRPGGHAYISEPVYAGAFNEVMRLFHDERRVRESAFAALCRSIDRGLLTLEREIHFLSQSRFEGFAEFERRILQATHSEHRIEPGLYRRIEQAFLPHVGRDGIATFLNPMRVDLLRRPD